jgi:hypothetical protein
MWDQVLQILQAFGFVVQPVVFGIGGAIATVIGNRLPHRLLWRLTDPNSVVYCIATSGNFDEGIYMRPMTGIGQVRALSFIWPSIRTAYWQAHESSIVLSQDITASHLKGDVVTLGGPNTNSITKEALEFLYPKTGFRFLKIEGVNSIEFGGEQIRPTVEPDPNSPSHSQIRKDYAVVICAESPFSEDRRLVVLAGTHTYGVEGAAKLFVKKLRKRAWRLPRDYLALAEVQLRSGEIQSLKLLRIKKI